jgi:hypothetical protein
MNDSGNKYTSSSDKDGESVRVIERGSRGSRTALFYKVLGLVLVGCFAGYLMKSVIHDLRSESDTIHSDQSISNEYDSTNSEISEIASSSSEATSNLSDHTLTARPMKPQTSRDPNDLANYIASGQTPTMGEVIERLHDAGVHSGLGAFNPPGTSPPMIGLAVPDDYVLPEGYVRHFQATDDGQRIEPILMYSPDFGFFDSAGQPIAIPENRVVPSNRAPPGLVIRPIEIPKPLEPGGP